MAFDLQKCAKAQHLTILSPVSRWCVCTLLFQVIWRSTLWQTNEDHQAWREGHSLLLSGHVHEQGALPVSGLPHTTNSAILWHQCTGGYVHDWHTKIKWKLDWIQIPDYFLQMFKFLHYFIVAFTSMTISSFRCICICTSSPGKPIAEPSTAGQGCACVRLGKMYNLHETCESITDAGIYYI